MHTLFANDCLVNALIPFVGRIDARLSLLTAQQSITATLPQPLPDALIDGFCDDMVREIQETRDAAASMHRGLSSDAIADFTYLLAAFVDETLISTFQDRLPHRFNGVLENTLFGTMDAGEQVFVRMDRVISRRSQSDAALAGAYLLVLSLGFRGQYFAIGAGEEISRYHHELSGLALAPGGEREAPRMALPAADHDAGWWRVPSYGQRRLLYAAVVATWVVAIIGMEVSWHMVTAPIRTAVAKLDVADTPVRGALQGAGR